MVTVYMVHLGDGEVCSQVCVKSSKELATFLDHIDEEKYKIDYIECINNYYTDWFEFCKKDNNLEIG